MHHSAKTLHPYMISEYSILTFSEVLRLCCVIIISFIVRIIFRHISLQNVQTPPPFLLLCTPLFLPE